MGNRPRFRFSILGLFGLTTITAVGLAVIRHPFSLAVLISPMSAAAVWLGVVLSLSLARDMRAAVSRRSLRPLHYYGHWVVAFFYLALVWLSYKALTVPLELDSPAHRQLAEWSRLAGACVGTALAIYFVSDKAFWAVEDE